MFKYVIEGGHDLSGNVAISGSKNAALTMLVAAILTDEVVEFENLPYTQDIVSMLAMFNSIGAKISMSAPTADSNVSVSVQFSGDIDPIGEYNFVRKMRASIGIFGPMLTRFGRAEVSLPGGCAIGVRPIDRHIKAMESLGAVIEIENGYVKSTAPKGGLVGNIIEFPSGSHGNTVGGTQNALMAATLANGKTIIKNAAIEPEVVSLVNMLNDMGAKISGQGTREITIEGVKKMHGVKCKIPTDRIQAFTYAMISAATGFGITLSNVNYEDFIGTHAMLEAMGIKMQFDNTKCSFILASDYLKPINITTAPIPGFPTDCQAQTMAVCTLIKGESIISEDIFENRMMHVPELMRMGADIKMHHNTAIVNGVAKIYGAEVMATDLRASASLVIAGLIAEGKTVINRTYHIERGYDFMPVKLEMCGAKISKIYTD